VKPKADFDLEHQFVNTQHYLKQFTYNEQFRIHGFQHVFPYKLLTQIHGQQGNNKQDNTSSSPPCVLLIQDIMKKKKVWQIVLYTHVNTVWKGCTGMAAV